MSTFHTCWDGVGTRDEGNGEREEWGGDNEGGESRGGDEKEPLLTLLAGLDLLLETRQHT